MSDADINAILNNRNDDWLEQNRLWLPPKILEYCNHCVRQMLKRKDFVHDPDGLSVATRRKNYYSSLTAKLMFCEKIYKKLPVRIEPSFHNMIDPIVDTIVNTKEQFILFDDDVVAFRANDILFLPHWLNTSLGKESLDKLGNPRVEIWREYPSPEEIDRNVNNELFGHSNEYQNYKSKLEPAHQKAIDADNYCDLVVPKMAICLPYVKYGNNVVAERINRETYAIDNANLILSPII